MAFPRSCAESSPSLFFFPKPSFLSKLSAKPQFSNPPHLPIPLGENAAPSTGRSHCSSHLFLPKASARPALVFTAIQSLRMNVGSLIKMQFFYRC